MGNLLCHRLMRASQDDPIWHPTAVSRNHNSKINDELTGIFQSKPMGSPARKLLLGDAYFSMDEPLPKAQTTHSLIKYLGKNFTSYH
jgi:hypothetical protein